MNRFLFLGFLFVLSVSCKFDGNSTHKIHVLVLSGSNNHDWQATTSFLQKMYAETGLFELEITEVPDTLTLTDLKNFDVVVSNWNSWPKNNLRWPESTEKALLDFINNGGGFVTFHSSTSAFYKWPEFGKITTAAWVDSTWHGKKSATQIMLLNSEHPVTKGMSGFFIQDELWVNAGKNSSFQILGTATSKDIFKQGIKDQAAIMISEYGKGKIFHTILGHDVRAMRNIGFRTLMLRGTEWAATGRVSQLVPQELQTNSDSESEYRWAKTDTSFTLMRGDNILWRYNFNERHGKPFFYPVYVGRNNLTCVSPDDHLWHLGQWFSWKYINGVNYWEYQNGTYKSDGVTEIADIKIIPNSDFSAEIKLKIIYHQVKGENVLAELRTIKVSPPQKNGSLRMSYQFEFEAVADTVELNRTPIEGEPNGMSWGGYAGLSIRFNQDFMDSHFISSWGENKNINGKSGDWLYMGFTGINGNQVGSQIIISPDSQRDGSAWYSVNTEDLPFYYFSPAYLYKKPLVLLRGKKLKLNYRVNHKQGAVDLVGLEKEYNRYKKEINQ
ncbi:MAG: PmoA family protein [Draconibacterium sp.]|nr:PmoA family protein [Draconibacterium sp.]